MATLADLPSWQVESSQETKTVEMIELVLNDRLGKKVRGNMMIWFAGRVWERGTSAHGEGGRLAHEPGNVGPPRRDATVSMALWLYGSMALWLYGSMALWPRRLAGANTTRTPQTLTNIGAGSLLDPGEMQRG